LETALDYLIGEKLFTFVEASEQDHLFNRELPAFVTEDEDAEELWPDDPVVGAEKLVRFCRVRQMLQE
jgi:hypothetical protein